MRIIACLLVWAGVCCASQVSFGKIASVGVKVMIGQEYEDRHRDAEIAISGKFLNYGNGELLLANDMEVGEVEATESGFKLVLKGSLNTCTFEDRNAIVLDQIATAIKEALANLNLTSPPELNRSRRQSRRMSGSRIASFVNQTSTPPKPLEPISEGLPRQRSRSKSPAPAVVSLQSNLVRAQSKALDSRESAAHLDESLKKVSLEEKKAKLMRRVSGGKPESGAIERVRGSWKRPKQEEGLKEEKEEARGRPINKSPNDSLAAADVKTKINAFNTSRQKLRAAETLKVTSLPKRDTVPRRKLRDFPFHQPGTPRAKPVKVLEGIGKDQMDALRAAYKRSPPKEPERKGKLERGTSTRTRSIFKENRPARPTLSRENSYEKTEDGYPELGFDEDSSRSRSSSKSPEQKGPENSGGLLTLPAITSFSHYYELFKDQDAFMEASSIIGKHRRATISLLEKMVLVRQRLEGRSLTDANVECSHDEIWNSQRIKTYRWNDQDTVELIESKIACGRTVYQIFNSAQFTEFVSERIFSCAPAAVGAELLRAEQSPTVFAPFKWNDDDCSLLVEEGGDRMNDLNDWVEHELMLPCWSQLRGEFDDGSQTEFALSFCASAQISDDVIGGEFYAQLKTFFKNQYKKCLLDTMMLDNYDCLVLSLPPQDNLRQIASLAIKDAIEEVEAFLTQFVIYIPFVEDESAESSSMQ